MRLDYKISEEFDSQWIMRMMRTVVVDVWRISRFPISIGWIAVESVYNVERPETTNDLKSK